MGILPYSSTRSAPNFGFGMPLVRGQRPATAPNDLGQGDDVPDQRQRQIDQPEVAGQREFGRDASRNVRRDRPFGLLTAPPDTVRYTQHSG